MNEPSSRDRITQIRIRGLRVIEDVTLDLDGLTVLIGDNGSGKSTLLEAFEILRLAAIPGLSFTQDVLKGFGSVSNLLRAGSSDLSLGVVIAGGPETGILDYSFTVRLVGTRDLEVVKEKLELRDDPGTAPVTLLSREGGLAVLPVAGPTYGSAREALENTAGQKLRMEAGELALSSFGRIGPRPIERVREALTRIEFQVPFEIRPIWQQRALGLGQGARWFNELLPTKSVNRFGTNLVNAFWELNGRGDAVADRVLAQARLALGSDLRMLYFEAAGRGEITLAAQFAKAPDLKIPIEAMSDGQLSFLLILAVTELDNSRSLLAFDEPELHLHPSLLVNALYLLERASEACPVVIATHSDRLLDALEDPVRSVRLCELDERRAMRFLRPSREKLDLWLEDYRGLGSLRAEGYDAAVFDPDRTARKGGR